jgi:hypothetical protein
MASILNRIWSQADFWDKKENQKQRQQFAQQAAAPQPAPQPQQQNQGWSIGRVVHDVTHNPVTNAVGGAVQHVAQPVFNLPQTVNNDVFKPINRDVIHPALNLGSRLYDQGNMLDGGRTFKQRTPTVDHVNQSGLNQLTHNGLTNVAGYAAQSLPQATVKVFSPAARSVIGTAQGLSGLYDLASPGVGTNRFSKALDWQAKQLDKAPHLSEPYYKVGQGVTDLAQFATGAGELKALASAPKVAKGIAPVAKVAGKYNKAVDKLVAPTIRDGNLFARTGARATKNILNPSMQAANVGFTGLQAGKEASTGRDVSPLGVATNLAVGGLVFPAAGAVGTETIKPVVQAGAKGIQLTKDLGLTRPTKLTNAELTASQKVLAARSGQISTMDITPQDAKLFYDSQVKLGVQPGTPEGFSVVDQALGAHRTFETQLQQRAQAIREAKQRLAVNNEIGAVGKNVNPKRALNGIQDYHDVLNGNKPKVVAAKISPELSARIKKETGVFVKPNVDAELSKPNAVHIEQRHGASSKDPNPLNDQAIGEMHHVLENPDRVSRGATVRGAPRVRLEKQLADNRVGVVEIIKKGDGANVVTYFNDSPSSRPGRLAISNRQDIRAKRDESTNLTNTVAKSTPKVKPSDPLAALKQEALKYKSADEFVNSHSPVYHGTNADLKDISQLQSGRQRGEYSSGTRSIFASENPELASKYGKNVLEGRNTGKVLDTTKLGDPHDPNNMVVPKEFTDYTTNPILDATDRRVLENSYFRGGTPSNIIIDHKPNIQEYFRSKGYSAIQIPRGSDVHGPATEMTIIDHGKIKTKQQLTDLYNQAHAEAKTKVPSSIQQSSSRGDVSNVQLVPSVQPRTKIRSDVPQQPSEIRASARQNTPSPVAPAQSALKGTGSRSELPTQSVAPVNKPPVSGVSQIGERKLIRAYPQYTRNKGFAQSVKQSSEVSPEVQKRSGGSYQTRNTQQMVDKADAHVNTNLPKAVDSTLASLNRKKGTLTDQEVTNAIATAKRLDANKNHSQATDIYNKLDEHLREHGRAIQAASVLNKRTPEGLRHSAFAELKKHGVTVTPQFEKAMISKIADIKKTQPGSLERDLNIKQLQKLVAKQIPSDLADKVTSTWKAGLLTGIRTQTGNALSNETFSVLHNISNLLAAPLDKTASVFTGQRTKALTGRGLVSGTKEGIGQGYKYLKTGIDERAPLTNKFMEGNGREVNFKSKAMNTYVNGVFRLMGAADRPHYYRQLRNSLYDLGKTDGLNKGLKGNALTAHIDNFVKDPPMDKFQLATNEAEKAVLANDTMLSHLAGKIQRLSDEAKSPVGKFFAKVAVNGIAPFTKVPSAFLSRVVDYTPAGALKEIATQVSKKQFDQRALVTAISEATTGTGIVWLGTQLANNDLLSGNYPNDPKEQQRWKAEGIQPNSVKVGNTWVSMNYLGPVGMLFAAGSRISDAQKQGGNSVQQVTAAATGVPKDLTEQSFLQGLNNAVSAVNDPGRYGDNFVKSQAGSIIPTLVNDVATATDSKQRQSDTVPDRIKSRIPGLRQTLPAAQDVYGNELGRKTNPVGSMVNPFRPSDAISNDVLKEVARLHNVDPNNSDLQVTPTKLNKVLSANGEQIKLTNAQRYQLQKSTGKATQKAWSQIIATPEYKALSDPEKAAALTNLRQDVAAVEKRKYEAANSVGAYAPDFTGKDKGLTAQQKRLAQGNQDFAAYVTKGGSAGSDASPADKYKTALANYQTNSKTMTEVQKYAAEKGLATLKVQAPFPSDVIKLYGMSKADAYQFVTTNKNGKKLAAQLIAYDKARYNAGLSKYMKYDNGIAPAKRGGKGGKGGGKAKYGAGAAAAFRVALRNNQPLKIVGALPAPTKSSVPTFKKPALKTVYRKKAVNTKPQSSLTRAKRLA